MKAGQQNGGENFDSDVEQVARSKTIRQASVNEHWHYVMLQSQLRSIHAG